MKKTMIAWDLGATKCTAGLIEFDAEENNWDCLRHATVKLVDTCSLEDLIEQLEAGLHLSMSSVEALCIGAAGFYDGFILQLAKAYPYVMNFADVAIQNKWPVFSVIHDYASIVCATFTKNIHHEENIKAVNNTHHKEFGRRIAFGIGTGLGLKDGVLFPDGNFWLGDNEAGHMGVVNPPHASADELNRHQELMHFMHHQQSGPVTFERILSGQGSVNLYRFFHHDEAITPEEVGKKMRAGEAEEMSDAFAWYAGIFTGTVQLAFMPEGGIWITGGLAQKHKDIFDRPEYVRGIHASPAYLTQRTTYPINVLHNHELALIGCGYYAKYRMNAWK